MKGIRSTLAVMFLMLGGCGLFDPREPEAPGQGGLDFVPATVPSIVISNLKNSVAQKNIDNYVRNFADPDLTGIPFIFVPSTDASSIYPNVREWSFTDEREYYQNLVAKADGFSDLSLVAIDSIIGAIEATYNFDYILTFEHTDAQAFPTTARGTLLFILAPDATNVWYVSSWSDFSNSEEITWSSFKGRFGN